MCVCVSTEIELTAPSLPVYPYSLTGFIVFRQYLVVQSLTLKLRGPSSRVHTAKVVDRLGMFGAGYLCCRLTDAFVLVSQGWLSPQVEPRMQPAYSRQVNHGTSIVRLSHPY